MIRNIVIIMLLLSFLASEILAGFVFSHTPNEFVFSQLSEVLLLGISLMVSVNFKWKIVPILLRGFLFMASFELIDEIRFRNNNTRWDDYVFFAIGIAGILYGLYKTYIHKKINAR